MQTFIGIDLGWYGKPSGLAALRLEGLTHLLTAVDRIAGEDAIFEWIDANASADCVVAVDAPLIIRNAAGIRPAERALNRDWRRYHAGCHPANLGRPFASAVTGFSARLERLGFVHGCGAAARASGRWQIEVHPHAAAVGLFGLTRILKYKKGSRAQRASELRRFRTLLGSELAGLEFPPGTDLPAVPERGDLKPAEDRLDAVLCAYVAAHWWLWAQARNIVYGDAETGYVIVPGTSLVAVD